MALGFVGLVPQKTIRRQQVKAPGLAFRVLTID